jgi:hypothetical protein
MFAGCAGVGWTIAWRTSKFGGDHEIHLEPEPAEGPDDVVVGWAMRRLLSSPVGATVLGAGCAVAAVFSAVQLLAAWHGDTARLDLVLRWLQPVQTLGDLIGLGEVTLALLLLAIWLFVAVARENEGGAALTVMMMLAYGAVALIAWPLGFLDSWLGFGRSVLSLL